jgi:3-hydroxyacyl-CoA dehydrogenase
VSRARTDSGIAAIVIVCAGRTFIAGADISEFGKPAREPTTIGVIEAIEASQSP